MAYQIVFEVRGDLVVGEGGLFDLIEDGAKLICSDVPVQNVTMTSKVAPSAEQIEVMMASTKESFEEETKYINVTVKIIKMGHIDDENQEEETETPIRSLAKN
jgi:hypothetical protein